MDLNLSGTSGDADLGYPVVAVAEGRVVHSAFHRVWGHVVMMEHDLPGLGRFWTQYAHLLFRTAQEGDYLLAGEPVGSVGRGDPARPYLAHLHFEVRRAPLDADFWPGSNVDLIREKYLDPAAFLRAHYAPARRFYRARGVLWGPARQEVEGVVVNLEDPERVQVAVRKP